MLLSKKPSTALPWYRAGGIPLANCIGAYKPKGAVDLATSYVNLAGNAAYNASPGSAPSFDAALGWVSTGDAWLTTGITPTANYSMIVRFNTGAYDGTQTGVIGTFNTTTAQYFAMRHHRGSAGDGHVYYYGEGFVIAGVRLTSANVLALSANKCFLNGVADGTVAGTLSTTPGIISLLSIAINGTPVAGQGLAGSLQAAAIYDIDISPYVAALTTAMNLL